MQGTLKKVLHRVCRNLFSFLINVKSNFLVDYKLNVLEEKEKTKQKEKCQTTN